MDPRIALPLSAKRLRLRPFEASDLDVLAAMLCDPETMKHFPQRFTREDARAWIERSQARYRDEGLGLWAVERRGDGVFLGDCGLVRRRVDGRDEVELGYHFARAHWGHGYATEAAAACLALAFGPLELERVIALIRPENEGSQGVARRNGMRVEKRIPWAELPHDVWVKTSRDQLNHS